MVLNQIFIDWIKLLLHGQESCVVDRRVTTQNFKLKTGACQGEPISACFFIF